jgi:hypothetical protein
MRPGKAAARLAAARRRNLKRVIESGNAAAVCSRALLQLLIDRIL